MSVGSQNGTSGRNRKIVAHIKNVPGSLWDPFQFHWSCPAQKGASLWEDVFWTTCQELHQQPPHVASPGQDYLPELTILTPGIPVLRHCKQLPRLSTCCSFHFLLSRYPSTQLGLCHWTSCLLQAYSSCTQNYILFTSTSYYISLTLRQTKLYSEHPTHQVRQTALQSLQINKCWRGCGEEEPSTGM